MHGASATGRHGVPEGLRAYRPAGTFAYIEGRERSKRIQNCLLRLGIRPLMYLGMFLKPIIFNAE
jgi:hypothetical protein